jgi:hypothetical protein
MFNKIINFFFRGKQKDSGFFHQDFRIEPIFLNKHSFDYKVLKPAFGQEAKEDVKTSLMEFYNDTPEKKCPHKILHNVRDNRSPGMGNFKEYVLNVFNKSSVQFSDYTFADDYDGTDPVKLDEKKWHDFVDRLEYKGAMRYVYDVNNPHIEVRLLWIDNNYEENYSKYSIKSGDKVRITYTRGNRVPGFKYIQPSYMTDWINSLQDIGSEDTKEFTFTKDGNGLLLYQNITKTMNKQYGGGSGKQTNYSFSIEKDNDGVLHIFIISKTPGIFSGNGYSTTSDLTSSATFGDLLLEVLKGMSYQIGENIVKIIL